jgi:hypothetical protein
LSGDSSLDCTHYEERNTGSSVHVTRLLGLGGVSNKLAYILKLHVHHRQNFVSVDGEKGLTEEDADRAIQILKGEEDC